MYFRGYKVVEMLLVEDSPEDAALALRALKKNNLINKIHVAIDGAEALDYIFGKDDSACLCVPKVVFLDEPPAPGAAPELQQR